MKKTSLWTKFYTCNRCGDTYEYNSIYCLSDHIVYKPCKKCGCSTWKERVGRNVYKKVNKFFWQIWKPDWEFYEIDYANKDNYILRGY